MDSEVGGVPPVKQEGAGADRPFLPLRRITVVHFSFHPSTIPQRSVQMRFFRTGTGIRGILFHLGQ